MFPLTDTQKVRLQMVVKDKETVEALKRFFLNVYLNDERGIQQTDILAASRLATTFLREAFRQLEHFTIDNQTNSPSIQPGL